MHDTKEVAPQDSHGFSWTLTCPVCGIEPSPLTIEYKGNRKPATASCASGHRFDAARQGHINLLTGRGTSFTPDSRDMVASRIQFLEAGHYEPIASAIREAIAKHASLGHTSDTKERADQGSAPLVLDAGCGTGYYLAHAIAGLGTGARGIGFDISPAAAQRAAHIDNVLALVWDVWRTWPIPTHSADAILNVFAPRNWEEFDRALKPSGALIVVTPLPEHLAEIRDLAGLLAIQEGKQEHLLADAARHGFRLVDEHSLKETMLLEPQAVSALAHMGPAGHHHSRYEIRARVESEWDRHVPETAQPDSALQVTCNVMISAFKKQ